MSELYPVFSNKKHQRLVFGVGVLCGEKTTTNNEALAEYVIWYGMLRRCYDSTFQDRHKTYFGCTVSENFKNFHYFKAWCNDQIGFGKYKFELDKDLLSKGNKIYSEDMCCFIPKEINLLIVRNKNKRGKYPIGVYYNKQRNRFVARVKRENKDYNLGSFLTPADAFYAYKIAKEDHVKDVANKWKDQIDPRVYEALMNWNVEITD